VSLASLSEPFGVVGAVGDVGKSFESVDSEKKPRWGGGGRFKMDLPGRIMGIADDDGEGEVGEVGVDDEDAIADLVRAQALTFFEVRGLNLMAVTYGTSTP
jgi:hypothetical protein